MTCCDRLTITLTSYSRLYKTCPRNGKNMNSVHTWVANGNLMPLNLTGHDMMTCIVANATCCVSDADAAHQIVFSRAEDC